MFMYEHIPTPHTRTPHSHHTYITRPTTTLRRSRSLRDHRDHQRLRRWRTRHNPFVAPRERGCTCKYYLGKNPEETQRSIGIEPRWVARTPATLTTTLGACSHTYTFSFTEIKGNEKNKTNSGNEKKNKSNSVSGKWKKCHTYTFTEKWKKR
jgi:hypothetical protein